MVVVQCWGCARSVALPQGPAGQRYACPLCGEVLPEPGAAPPPLSAPAPPPPRPLSPAERRRRTSVIAVAVALVVVAALVLAVVSVRNRAAQEFRRRNSLENPAGCVSALRHPDPAVRRAAVATLEALATELHDAGMDPGGGDRPVATDLAARRADLVAVADLLPVALLSDDPKCIESAEHCLIELRHDGTAAVALALNSPDPALRLRAARLLPQLQPPLSHALSDLLGALTVPEAEVRTAAFPPACQLLGIACPHLAAAGVPPLVTALADRDPEIRREAIAFLSRALDARGRLLDRDTDAAVAALLAAVAEGSSPTDAQALNIVQHLGPAAFAGIARALPAQDRALRRAALRALPPGLAPPPELILPLLAASDDEDPAAAESARRALEAVTVWPGEAIPGLLRRLRLGSLSTRKLAVGVLAGARPGPIALPGLVHALADAEPAVRAAAARTLASIGNGPKDRLEDLAWLGANPEKEGEPAVFRRQEAQAGAEDLGQIVRREIAGLVSGLHDSDPGVRTQAARALSWLGKDARAAMPELLGGMVTGSPEGRLASLQLLRAMAPDAPEALPALAAAIRAPDPVLRKAARAWLATFGAAAVPALTEAARDPNRPVAEEAAADLRALGPAAVESVPALLEMMASSNATMRRSAAAALARMGPGARRALTPLLRALGDPDASVRQQAIEAVRAVTLGDAEALPVLRQAASDADGAVRVGACAVLAMHSDAGRAVLAGRLQDQDAAARREVAESLRYALASAESAVLLLKTAVQDADPAVRRAALASCVALGARVRPTAPAILPLLQDPDPTLRRDAALALRAVGPGARDVVTALVQAFGDPDASVAEAAGLALTEAKGAATTAVAQLLTSPQGPTRVRAARLLGSFGPEGKRAIVPLMTALRDGEAPVRAAAATALGSIGSAARAALPALQQLQKDPNPEVAQAAALATALIQRK